MDEKEFVVLLDDNDEEQIYELVEVVNINGLDYALLILSEFADEYDETNDEAELTVLRIETDDEGEEVFVEIDDDDEYEEVYECLINAGMGITEKTLN